MSHAPHHPNNLPSTAPEHVCFAMCVWDTNRHATWALATPQVATTTTYSSFMLAGQTGSSYLTMYPRSCTFSSTEPARQSKQKTSVKIQFYFVYSYRNFRELYCHKNSALGQKPISFMVTFPPFLCFITQLFYIDMFGQSQNSKEWLSCYYFPYLLSWPLNINES